MRYVHVKNDGTYTVVVSWRGPGRTEKERRHYHLGTFETEEDAIFVAFEANLRMLSRCAGGLQPFQVYPRVTRVSSIHSNLFRQMFPLTRVPVFRCPVCSMPQPDETQDAVIDLSVDRRRGGRRRGRA